MCESVPDEGVGVGLAVGGGEHDPGEVLEVDLVADAGVGRHDPEVVEGALAPPEELVALLVALELAARRCDANASGVPNRSTITEWSMTSSAGTSGLTAAGSPPNCSMASRIAARSTTAGHAGEVLHQDAGRGEGDLAVGSAGGVPVGERGDVVGGDRDAVLVAEQVLEEDPERERQVGDVADVVERRQGVDAQAAVADRQFLTAAERVGGHGGPPCRRWVDPIHPPRREHPTGTVRSLISPGGPVVAFLSDEWCARFGAGGGTWAGTVPDTTVQTDVSGGPDGAVTWHVSFAGGAVATCARGSAPEPTVALTTTWADAVAIARGDLDANAAYMLGRVKTDGATGPLLALLAALRTEAGRAARDDLAADTEF